jgi:predicted amidophosphoribosyltransferase
MGEIADMMLDGTLCQCCGAYIGDESNGDYPQYCAACAKDVKEQEQKRGDDEK